MDLRILEENDKTSYNKLVTHVMQSWEWGQFRQKLGTPITRYGIFENNKLVTAFTISFHKIPLTNFFVGYLPKGPFPDSTLAKALAQIATDRHCAFIKLEPNIRVDENLQRTSKIDKHFRPSSKPLFTKYNFVLDLTPSEQTLLSNLNQKTRYNVRLAEKKGVTVTEDNSPQAFKEFLKLYFDTTRRQGFFGHNEHYHQTVFQTMIDSKMAHLLIARYNDKPLSSWLLLEFQDTLYYPYGGSSVEHKDVMANNLIAWHAIRLGQKLKLKSFDMWGSLGPNPDPTDSYIGFHRFKSGFGGKLVEYIGTFDLIQNQFLYALFTNIDKATKLKVLLLKLLGK